MEIQASSVYDLEAFKVFLYLYMYKGKNPKEKVRNLFVLSLVVIVAAIIEIIVFDYYLLNVLMRIIIVVAVIADLINCFLYFWGPKILYKAEKLSEDVVNHFIFYDDGFEGFSTEKGYIGSPQVKYDTLTKIIENEKYFFIYENKVRTYIVGKNTIKSEDMKALKAKFREAIPTNKYITISKW